jgi:CRP-like cAMP-binding protein
VIRHARLVNSLGPRDGFGEVALLGDEPRTATVRAAAGAPLRVAIIERPAFLTAVTGYPVSAATGHDVVTRIQARDDAGLTAANDDGARHGA